MQLYRDSQNKRCKRICISRFRGNYSRTDKVDNILQRVDIQVNWLREIGYQHADCYFKWFELAVFGGVK